MSCRPKPSLAVAQKVQSSAQPTCDEMHCVSLGRRGKSACSRCSGSSSVGEVVVRGVRRPRLVARVVVRRRRVAVGDEHRLDHPPVVGAQAQLARAVARDLLGVDGERAHLGGLGETRAQRLAEIGHRLDVGDAPAVHPAEDLVAAIGLDAERAGEGARLLVRQIAQIRLIGQRRHLSMILTGCFPIARRAGTARVALRLPCQVRPLGE